MNKPAEKNNLIYKIFNFPLIYNIYQKIIFRKDSKNKIFNEYIKVNKKDLVLDIGCGPGNYRQLIKSENYFGIDINCKSIDQAKEIYPNDNFDCLPVQEISSKLNKKFDKIILLGLLHHISDQDAINLFNDLKNVVMPQSQVFCLGGPVQFAKHHLPTSQVLHLVAPTPLHAPSHDHLRGFALSLRRQVLLGTQMQLLRPQAFGQPFLSRPAHLPPARAL